MKKLDFEVLERRDVPAVNAVLDAQGVLTVTGDEANNNIAVEQRSLAVVVFDYSQPRGQQEIARFDAAEVQRVEIDGLGGDDTLSGWVDADTLLRGGDGDDDLSLSGHWTGHENRLEGGAGNDNMRNTSWSHAAMNGGSGADTFFGTYAFFATFEDVNADEGDQAFAL